MLFASMPTLSNARIATLLIPYLNTTPIPDSLYSQLSLYLDLLLRWKRPHQPHRHPRP